MEKLPLNTSNQEDTQSNNDSSDKQSNGPSKLDQFLGSVQYPQDDESPKIVTEEKLQCYTKFKSIPVIVEGPEQSQDFSYFLVDKNDDLKSLERGIILEEFVDMRDKRRYEMEFRILQRMTQHKGHVKNLYNSPKMEFKKQNRYNEVLPFSHSRVLLSEQINTAYQEEDTALANDELNHYINANYINTFVRDKGKKAFIATQAPVDYTLEKFWHMIWENKTQLIIMLCPLQGPKKNAYQGTQEESMHYWCEKVEMVRKIGEDSFLLTFISQKEVTPGITKRKFELKNLRSEEPPLVVRHMQNVRWEDDDATADEEHFNDIDCFVKKIKKLRARDNPSPVLVHCSAGIGRTGTLISIYAIAEAVEMMEHSSKHLADLEIDPQIMEDYPNTKKPRISVFGAVRRMREQRWNMVKKQVQYNFIYDYLERWVRKNFFDMFLDKDEFAESVGSSSRCAEENPDQ